MIILTSIFCCVLQLASLPEGNEKIALLLEYNKFKAVKCGKPPGWTHTLLETTLSPNKERTSKDRRPLKFTRILNTVKTHLGCRKSLFH